jgi:hypothetical protein
MSPQESIPILERLQEPEPWEPQISRDAYEALELAIEALEKQIPKPPKMGYAFPEKIRAVMTFRGDNERAEAKTDCCPACGRPLGTSKFVQSQTGMRFGDPYCKRCGQAIDWGVIADDK